ncbi:MAG: nucleotide sugar dehydrogenase [Candidatus Aenigmarchaeota archaeon]|nr:nucleotide sugar dehydrogenase [Candidatus Aenigmarchaeota archaeon]
MALQELLEKVKSGRYVMSVIGVGRVGLPLSVAFASRGVRVYGVDVSAQHVQNLREGKIPFKEDLIEKFFPNENFIPTTDSIGAVNQSDVIILTIGTPLTEHTREDYSQLNAVLDGITKVDLRNKIIIMRSTSSPGTLENIIIPNIEKRTGLKCGKDFAAAVCPERIVEGKALEELWILPEFIGVKDDTSFEVAKEVFLTLNKDKVILKTTPKSAELGKLFTNVYRYINFALANEFGLLAEFHGEDAHEIINMLNYKYHRGGLPRPGLTGGPCLSKDGYYLISHLNFPDFILFAWRLNESIPKYVVNKVKRELEKSGKQLWQSKIAVLGRAFKANIDDLRYSPAENIVEILKTENADIYAHDPHVKGSHSLEESVMDADAIILAVNHNEFKGIENSLQGYKQNCILFDCWGMIDPLVAEKRGFKYMRFGSGKHKV